MKKPKRLMEMEAAMMLGTLERVSHFPENDPTEALTAKTTPEDQCTKC